MCNCICMDKIKKENDNEKLLCSEFGCKDPVTCWVSNPFYGLIPSCDKHKESLSKIYMIVSDRYGNTTTYARSSLDLRY